MSSSSEEAHLLQTYSLHIFYSTLNGYFLLLSTDIFFHSQRIFYSTLNGYIILLRFSEWIFYSTLNGYLFFSEEIYYSPPLDSRPVLDSGMYIHLWDIFMLIEWQWMVQFSMALYNFRFHGIPLLVGIASEIWYRQTSKEMIDW